MKKILSASFLLFSLYSYCQEPRSAKIYYHKKDGSLSTKYITARVLSLDVEDLTNEELWNYYLKYKTVQFPLGKPLYILNRNDTAKIAATVNETIISKYWNNGNIKSYFICRGVGRDLVDFYKYHENSMLKMSARYYKERKMGKWKYYDEDGKKYKIEKYDATGNLKKLKELSIPRKTLKTAFQKQKSSGVSYIIQY